MHRSITLMISILLLFLLFHAYQFGTGFALLSLYNDIPVPLVDDRGTTTSETINAMTSVCRGESCDVLTYAKAHTIYQEYALIGSQEGWKESVALFEVLSTSEDEQIRVWSSHNAETILAMIDDTKQEGSEGEADEGDEGDESTSGIESGAIEEEGEQEEEEEELSPVEIQDLEEYAQELLDLQYRNQEHFNKPKLEEGGFLDSGIELIEKIFETDGFREADTQVKDR